MASLSLIDVGTLFESVSRTGSVPVSPTYIEVVPGVYLVASVGVSTNQCIIELLSEYISDDCFPCAASGGAGDDDVHPCPTSQVSHVPNSTVPVEDEDLKEWLAALKLSFRAAKFLDVLKGEEGSITAIEFARDFTRALSNSEEGEVDTSKSVRRPYVHLFVGTSHGTVVICNALRGTIMAIAMLPDYNRILVGEGKRGAFAHTMNTSREQACAHVVRFAVHASTADTFLNPNVPQNTSGAHDAHLNAVYIVLSDGKVVILGRGAINVLLDTALEFLDGARPHVPLEWQKNAALSPFPVAGPASEFASHVQCVLSLSEVDPHVIGRFQPPRSAVAAKERSIKDAAFYLSCSCEAADVFTDSAESQECLLLCGTAPAFATYAYKKDRNVFSVRKALGAVASVLGGVKRLLPGIFKGDSNNTVLSTMRPSVSSHRAKNVFLDADMTVSALQVDPTLQWVACYCENAGSIYVYDLMGDAICQVIKGCRPVDFQWHVAIVGGKRMLVLVVHRILRHSLTMYSLRLGRRVAARYVPQGSILLRSGISSLTSRVLLLKPDGVVSTVEVKLKESRTEPLSGPCCAASLTELVAASQVSISTGGATHRAVGGLLTPYDVLVAALRVPLPDLAADESSFDVYCSRINKLEDVIKRQFSPGLFDDCRLAVVVGAKEDNIPRDISAAQCLNYVQLRLACVGIYRRAFFNRLHVAKSLPVSVEDLTSCNKNDSIFTSHGELNPSLKGMVDGVVQVLLTEMDAISFNQITEVCRSMESLLMKRNLSGSCSSDIVGHASPISLEAFLKLFHCGGRKLVFLRDLAGCTKEDANSFDRWAEIGSAFFDTDSGISCFSQQVDVFSPLGFHAADVVMITLCWLCRTLATTRSPCCLGTVPALLFFMRNTDEDAFFEGLESIPCFIGKRHLQKRRCEVQVLLLILLVVLRQDEKPFSCGNYARYKLLLKRFLGVHAIIAQCESESEDDDWSETADSGLLQHVRLGDLAIHESGDALNILFFQRFPSSLAVKLCANVPGSDILREQLAGVDHLHWMKLFFMMRGTPPSWGVDSPWYHGGTWDHVLFLTEVVHPTIKLFKLVTQDTPPKSAWVSAASPKQLAGLAVLLVVGLVILERELTPLRLQKLAFFMDDTLPDSNPFEGIATESCDFTRHPLGSRSTRDYFNSCRELLATNIQMAEQLFGEDGSANGTRIASSVIEAIVVDDAAVFPLVPVEFRRVLYRFVEDVCHDPKRLLESLEEARHLIDTVIFFAFRATGSVPLPSRPLVLSWSTMYGDPSTIFSFLLETDVNQERVMCPLLMEKKMKARSEFVRAITFVAMLNVPSILGGDFIQGLCDATGLNRLATDFHILVLFDNCSKLLLPSIEVKRLADDACNRHLVALLAVVNFKLLIRCCYKYFMGMKDSVSRGDRSRKQQLALRVQAIDDAMPEEFRHWVHSDQLHGGGDWFNDAVRADNAEGGRHVGSKLFFSSAWFDIHYASVMERRVTERLDPPRDPEKLRDFHNILFVLARTAVEGAASLPRVLRSIACGLPSVAAKVANLL